MADKTIGVRHISTLLAAAMLTGTACSSDGARTRELDPGGAVRESAALANSTVNPIGVLVTSSLAGTQSLPAAAWNGTLWLVVWQDDRNGALTDIFGTRVSASGTILDPGGLVISTAPNGQLRPAVASDGDSWLVVWEDTRNGGGADIFGARVTAAGAVLDPSGFIVSAAVDEQREPDIAYTDGGYLVLWSDRRSGIFPQIFGARVDTSGSVLDPTGFALAPTSNQQTSPAVAPGVTGWFAAWTDKRSGDFDIYGSRVSTAGTVLDVPGIPIVAVAGEQGEAALALGPEDWLCVWSDRRGSNFDIYGSRVSPGGIVLDPAGIPISTAADGQEEPSVAYDGATWLAAWIDARDSASLSVAAARLDTAGTLLDPSGFSIANGTLFEGVALSTQGAGTTLAAYATQLGSSHRVEASLIEADCSTVTTDTDGDGVVDCADACPTDAGVPPDGCPTGGTGGAGGAGGTGGTAGSSGGGASGTGGGHHHHPPHHHHHHHHHPHEHGPHGSWP